MRYRPLRGEVLTAQLLEDEPSFVKGGRRRKKGAKGMGLRYERKVQRYMLGRFPGYMPGPWFRYTTDDEPGRKNYAQPDGIIVDVESGQITIVEVKYNHCAEAYFQLVDKYLPIVRTFFNNSDIWAYATLEVVYWFDVAVAFPTQPKLRAEINDVRLDELAVHIWRPPK